MELIKDMIKEFYPLLIVLSCVTFALWIFFSTEIFVGKGVMEGAGMLYTSMLDSDELKNNGLIHADSVGSGYIPIAKYVGSTQTVGDQTFFKDLFYVRKENGSFVSGSTEDEFALYLIDIKTLSGSSVLEILPTVEIENLQEIPAPFIYDKEEDVLYFHGSGTYVVYIKIYGKSGGQTTYEFQLPVETS